VGSNPNHALPQLFIELFPTWLAALIGVGILAAIMSTADGLVVSSSQIIANDIYRRSIVPRLRSQPDPVALDRRVLAISRWSTVVVLVLSTFMAWALMDMNIALLVWIGTGGMMAAFAGPLVVGALWRGVTRAGAYSGLLSGMGLFIILHSGVIDPSWFGAGLFHDIASWLHGESTNPFSCAAMGEFVSVGVTWSVSRLTQPLEQTHIENMFGPDPAI